MNVSASAYFSGFVKLPGTVKLGTWDLSQSNIHTMIINEIRAKTISTDTLFLNGKNLRESLNYLFQTAIEAAQHADSNERRIAYLEGFHNKV